MLRCAALIAALSAPMLMWAGELTRGAGPSPSSVIESLKRGNDRYVAESRLMPKEYGTIRRQLVAGQYPRAVILGCADSRVPPEIIFDQGLGDLFTVRVAGNITTEEVMGSVEYAVEHLHTPVVVVLGHEKCGAVSAALHPEGAAGHIRTLLEALQPAVDRVKDRKGSDAEHVHDAVAENVDVQVHHLTDDDPVVHEEVLHDRVVVVGAIYDIETGRVRFLENKSVSELQPLPH